VRLSSGYPRIVEALEEGYPDLIHKNPKSLQHALSIIGQALARRNLNLAVTLDDLRLALLSKEVTIDSVLPSNVKCATKIENGTFICPTRGSSNRARSAK
jgi:hypothetical protein